MNAALTFHSLRSAASLIEQQAKKGRKYAGVPDAKIEIPPSLQLSWVSRKLRSVFMPRIWGYLRLSSTRQLAKMAKLLKASPPDTFRSLVKLVAFGGDKRNDKLNLRFYHSSPPPRASSDVDPRDAPIRGTAIAARATAGLVRASLGLSPSISSSTILSVSLS